MEGLKSRVAEGVVELALAAVPLTPALALLNGLSPYRLPWVYVFIPWIGALHLLMSWVAGQMIAHVLSAIFDGGSHR